MEGRSGWCRGWWGPPSARWPRDTRPKWDGPLLGGSREKVTEGQADKGLRSPGEPGGPSLRREGGKGTACGETGPLQRRGAGDI